MFPLNFHLSFASHGSQVSLHASSQPGEALPAVREARGLLPQAAELCGGWQCPAGQGRAGRGAVLDVLLAAPLHKSARRLLSPRLCLRLWRLPICRCKCTPTQVRICPSWCRLFPGWHFLSPYNVLWTDTAENELLDLHTEVKEHHAAAASSTGVSFLCHKINTDCFPFLILLFTPLAKLL